MKKRICKHRVHQRRNLYTDSVFGKSFRPFCFSVQVSLSFFSPKSHIISYINLRNINLESLSNTLSQKLLSLPSYQDTYVQAKFYNNSLIDLLNDFAPLITKQIQRRKTLPWYLPEIKDAKKLCRKLERLWKK